MSFVRPRPGLRAPVQESCGPVCRLQEPDLPDGGDDLPRLKAAAQYALPDRVHDRGGEEWNQRAGDLSPDGGEPPHGGGVGPTNVIPVLGAKTADQKGRRLAKNQAWVVILAEDKGDDGMGRVRLETVERTNEEVLGAVVQRHVEKGSELRTDAWNSYRPLAKKGYSHDPRNVSASGRPAHEQLPLVHLVASLLKRYVVGILHGSWRRHWLPWLLTEFEFRFNRRRSRRRPLLFNRVMEVGLGMRPPTRDAMTEFARLATCTSL